MPFVPYQLFSNLTHMGLKGDDMRDVSAAFFFVTTSPLFRANAQRLLGAAPSRAATKYIGAAMAPPPDKKTS